MPGSTAVTQDNAVSGGYVVHESRYCFTSQYLYDLIDWNKNMTKYISLAFLVGLGRCITHFANFEPRIF